MNYRTSLLAGVPRFLLCNADGENPEGGGGGGGGGAPAWDQVRATLAGGNQERATLLQQYDSPDKLFGKLSAAAPETKELDWRKAIAGDDAEAMKRLERFPDLPTYGKAFNDTQKALHESGRVRIPGEGATDAEKAEWAKAIGLAEKPDAYEIKVKPPEGYQVGDGDKAVLGRLQSKLHEALANGARAPDLMNVATQFYYDEAAAAGAATEERAAEAAIETEVALKELWGGQFEDNIRWAVAGAKQFFPASSPDKAEEEFDGFLGLTLASGHKLGDHPAFLRMFSQIGRQFAEDPFFQKMKGENKGFDPEARKVELMKLRETNPRLYADPKTQAELDRINAGLARRAEQGRAA